MLQGIKNKNFQLQLHHILDSYLAFNIWASKKLAMFICTFTQSCKDKWHVYNSFKNGTEDIFKILKKLNQYYCRVH